MLSPGILLTKHTKQPLDTAGPSPVIDTRLATTGIILTGRIQSEEDDTSPLYTPA